jgi:AcrR family transcriptional regulator
VSPATSKRAAVPTRRDEARALFRNAILDAAEAVFAERGFERARIQDIALRARTAVGTVYNHFEHKEEVLRALLDERTEGLLAEIAAQPGDPSRFAPRLEVRLRRCLRFIDRHRGFFVVAMENGLIGAPTTEGRRIARLNRWRAALVALAEEGVREGVLEPIDAARVARFLGAVLRTAFVDAVENGQGDLEAQAAELVDLFLHGAGRRRKRER